MSELLEFVLNVVLELLCDLPNVQEYWRFVLPVLGSLAVVGLIVWRISGVAVQFGLSAPVVIAGIWLGILWQARDGQGR